MTREPDKGFGGRLRTSTVVLMIVFAGILVLYVFIRPAPAQPTNSDNSTPVSPQQHQQTPSPSRAPKPSPTPSVTPLRSPTPSMTSTPTPTHTQTSLLPLPTHS